MNTNLNGFNYMLCSIHIIRIFLKFLTSTNWFPVISYPNHSVPFSSFRIHVRFIMVISYPVWSFLPVWSFSTYFCIFIYNHFSHFLPSFYIFVPKSFRTQGHFVPNQVISYPGHAYLGAKCLGYELTYFLSKQGMD